MQPKLPFLSAINELHFGVAALQLDACTVPRVTQRQTTDPVQQDQDDLTPPKSTPRAIASAQSIDQRQIGAGLARLVGVGGWRAERLAGAMSSFRPGGMRGGIGAHLGYSPLCVPRVINGISCVIVSEQLRDIEPMAWDFVMSFARDNQLQVTDACLLPEAGSGSVS
jgi:hypothetical protein